MLDTCFSIWAIINIKVCFLSEKQVASILERQSNKCDCYWLAAFLFFTAEHQKEPSVQILIKFGMKNSLHCEEMYNLKARENK